MTPVEVNLDPMTILGIDIGFEADYYSPLQVYVKHDTHLTIGSLVVLY